MKYFILYIFLIWLFCCLTGQAQDYVPTKCNDLIGSKLKGNVRRISTYSYDYDTVEKRLLPSIISVVMYNIGGYKIIDTEIVFHVYKDRIDTTTKQWYYAYNDSNKLLGSRFCTQSKGGDNGESRTTYIYTPEGRLKQVDFISKFDYRRSNIKNTSIYKYDANGNNTEIESSGNGSFANRKTQIKYSPSGIVKEFEEHYSSGERYLAIFDGKQRLIDYKNFGSDGSLRNKNVYIYDQNGDEIQKKGYDAKGILNYRRLTKWNEHRILVEEKEYGPDGKITRIYIFKPEKYDKNGNYLRATSSWDNDKSLTERIIEYY